MAAGRMISEEDEFPLSVGTEMMESVKEFTYLGSVVVASGRVDADICRQEKCTGIKGIWSPEESHTKHLVYHACVLSVLPLRKHLKKMDAFHNRCIRITLGISRKEQWSQHLPSQEIREGWGDIETVGKGDKA